MLKKPSVTIRINPLKTGRRDLKRVLFEKYSIEMENTEYSPIGMRMRENSMFMSLFETDEYQRGLFELQDEGS